MAHIVKKPNGSFLIRVSNGMWIKESRLHSYAVGSRKIVAMEGFDYSKLFAKPICSSKKNRTTAIKMSEQYEELLSKTTQGYTCQRKR